MQTIGKDYLPPSNAYLGSSKDTLGTPGCGSLAPALRCEGSQNRGRMGRPAVRIIGRTPSISRWPCSRRNNMLSML